MGVVCGVCFLVKFLDVFVFSSEGGPLRCFFGFEAEKI